MLLLLYPYPNAVIRLLWLAGIILLSSPATRAQNTGDWYLSKVLNDNNGLPQNSIRSMYYDKKTDFLWLATEAGLVRYDGQDAKVFDRRDMPSLQSMRIVNFVPSVGGKVFGCTMLGETFALHQNFPEAQTGGQTFVLQSIGYRRGNIKSVDALSLEKTALVGESFSLPVVYNRMWLNDSTWLTDIDSFICMARNEQIIHRWPKKKDEELIYYIVRGKWVYAINNTGQGYCINVESKRQLVTTVKSNVLLPDKPGFYYDNMNDRPLLISGDEVHDLVFKNDTISTNLIAVLPGLTTSTASIVFDKSGRYLFVATTTTGLYIYHRSSFKIYTAAGINNTNNNYGCVLVDSNHLFTNRSLLFDLATGASKKISVSINTNCIGSDSAGRIWFGGYVSSFSINQPAKVTRAPSTGQNIFMTAYYSPKTGRLWISTGNDFGYANGRDMQSLIKYPNPEYFIYYITETSSGELIGINKSGIYSIDTIRKKLIPKLTDSLVTQIRTAFVDSAGRCWISTYGNGLFLYHLTTKKLTRLPLDDKGYLQYGHVFIDEGADNFLIPTNKGLFRLSKNNLLQIDSNAATPLYYQYFDVADGLLTNEFNGGCQPAFNRLPNGDIIIPALQGLVRVKISELPNPVNGLLFLDKVQTKHRRYNVLDTCYFQKDERVQTWSLSYAQWDQPNGQGIFYMLDNDSMWQRLPAGEKNIQLNELKGGWHSLRIKYQFGLQPHHSTTSGYHFYIDKFYYETVWFWLAMVLLLASVIYFSVRIRSRQLKKKNMQLEKIVRQKTGELSNKNEQLEETLLDLNEALEGLQDNSIFKNRLIGLLGHDLLGPLRFIASVADHLNRNASKLGDTTTKENTAEISHTATELLYLGESLIQWIKLLEGSFRLIVQPIDLRSLAEEIMQVHRPIAAAKKNGLQCNIPFGTFCRYDPILLKVILHNLLLNANKFTSGGHISIRATVTPTCLQMQVQDSGTGMNPAMVASLNNLMPAPSQTGTHKETGFGMGYMLIIDLLRFAEGKLRVESEIGEGTTVGFTLPVGNS